MNLKKLLKLKEFRFLTVGGFNTLVTYMLYVFLVYMKVNYILSMAVIYILGIIIGYYLNRIFTFKSNGSKVREFARYVIVYAAGFLISLGLLYVLVEYAKINPVPAGIINIMMVTVFTWFGHRYYSFKGVE